MHTVESGLLGGDRAFVDVAPPPPERIEEQIDVHRRLLPLLHEQGQTPEPGHPHLLAGLRQG